MKDVIVAVFTKPCFEIGEGSFGRDVFGKTGIQAIGPAPVFISEYFKKLIHILMPVNVSEQLKQKERRWVISRRAFSKEKSIREESIFANPPWISPLGKIFTNRFLKT
jgi:hypothetical protein